MIDQLPGIESLVTTAQNARMGSQPGRSPYQLMVQAQTIAELQHWSARLTHQMSQDAMFSGVRTDAQETALQATIRIDHDKARQLGITSEQLRSTLHTGFAARQAATIDHRGCGNDFRDWRRGNTRAHRHPDRSSPSPPARISAFLPPRRTRASGCALGSDGASEGRTVTPLAVTVMRKCMSSDAPLGSLARTTMSKDVSLGANALSTRS